MSDFAIQAHGLVKVFTSRWSRREVRAVDGISFTVEPGTTFGLLGPNGAGKTTCVKMLLSAVHPTSGHATIFGLDSRQIAARLPIGYLPENHRFPTYFTGAGMLDLYGSLSGMDAAARRRRIPELLELVGLEKWGDVRLGKYSKGMLQRVGLAQAILHQPRLLILDAPTDGVDPVGRIHIREILQRLEAEGATIFINSHQLAEVEMFCRDVAILHRGKVALAGRVKEFTGNRGWRIVAAGVPEALRAELAGEPVATDATVRFALPDLAAANAALDRLRAAGATIHSLNETTSTLEEVFVRTVRQQQPEPAAA
ncbi:MAG: ABC transporter ATP-binding protein [Bryobacterales bacterium]|nr:ABC transporter ATP-binding protein [Bryobacterales bacterium]